jgi:hypothetical protein
MLQSSWLINRRKNNMPYEGPKLENKETEDLGRRSTPGIRITKDVFPSLWAEFFVHDDLGDVVLKTMDNRFSFLLYMNKSFSRRPLQITTTATAIRPSGARPYCSAVKEQTQGLPVALAISPISSVTYGMTAPAITALKRRQVILFRQVTRMYVPIGDFSWVILY